MTYSGQLAYSLLIQACVYISLDSSGFGSFGWEDIQLKSYFFAIMHAHI